MKFNYGTKQYVFAVEAGVATLLINATFFAGKTPKQQARLLGKLTEECNALYEAATGATDITEINVKLYE